MRIAGELRGTDLVIWAALSAIPRVRDDIYLAMQVAGMQPRNPVDYEHGCRHHKRTLQLFYPTVSYEKTDVTTHPVWVAGGEVLPSGPASRVNP